MNPRPTVGHDGLCYSGDYMTGKLLGKLDPTPFECFNEEGASPFVFASEHAGNLVPKALENLGLSAADLGDHIGWDLHIRDVGARISKLLDAPYVCQPYSRLVIDCNRPPESPQSILAVSDNRIVPGNEGLAAADVALRQSEIFQPFHEAIAALLDSRAVKDQQSILITLHSFTPAMKSGGADRPWQITFQYGRQPEFSKKLIKMMAADASICVGDNVPYPVQDATHYGIPEHGEKRNLLHTMIEIRQDGIESEAGKAFWAQKIADVLSEFLETV